ncbi:YybH family protein [Planococcus donghaensis]|uniref:YybH family protein n=1 Tax=Planococcus donghaensis TaxID=414778 RepID=UPI003735B995
MKNEIFKVEDMLKNYKDAVHKKDAEKFLSAYADDVHIYDCWERWESKGISLWRESVVGWFNELNEDGYSLNVDFNDVTIVENNDVAFVHCAVTYAAFKDNVEEKIRQMTNRFTFGLKKVNESWRIVHEHSSVPINKDTGKGNFN